MQELELETLDVYTFCMSQHMMMANQEVFPGSFLVHPAMKDPVAIMEQRKED